MTMASLLGSSVPFPCPACDEPMTVPVRQTGVDRDMVTVVMDLGPWRAHIAAAHNGRSEHREAVASEQPPEPGQPDDRRR